jgi:hypothetical protein
MGKTYVSCPSRSLRWRKLRGVDRMHHRVATTKFPHPTVRE